MSRKDFIAIAAALLKVRPATSDTAAYRAWRESVEAIADVCASHNAQFNRPKFLAACGHDGK